MSRKDRWIMAGFMRVVLEALKLLVLHMHQPIHSQEAKRVLDDVDGFNVSLRERVG